MKKILILTFLFSSFGVMADSSELPLLSIKERLRLHMWSYGLEDVRPQIKGKASSVKPLPEEIERPLRKL